MRLLDLVYPPRCVLCHAWLPRGGAYTCDECSRRILQQEPIRRKQRFLDGMVAALPYEEPYRGSVQRFKFGGCAFYAYPYADWLSACVRSELDGAEDLAQIAERITDGLVDLVVAVGEELHVAEIEAVICIGNEIEMPHHASSRRSLRPL